MLKQNCQLGFTWLERMDVISQELGHFPPTSSPNIFASPSLTCVQHDPIDTYAISPSVNSPYLKQLVLCILHANFLVCSCPPTNHSQSATFLVIQLVESEHTESIWS